MNFVGGSGEGEKRENVNRTIPGGDLFIGCSLSLNVSQPVLIKGAPTGG